MFVLFPKRQYIHLHHIDVRTHVVDQTPLECAGWAYCTYADHLHSICTAGLTISGFIRCSVWMLYHLPPQCAVNLSWISGCSGAQLSERPDGHVETLDKGTQHSDFIPAKFPGGERWDVQGSKHTWKLMMLKKKAWFICTCAATIHTSSDPQALPYLVLILSVKCPGFSESWELCVHCATWNLHGSLWLPVHRHSVS